MDKCGRWQQCLTYFQDISGGVAGGCVWIPQIGVSDFTFYKGYFLY